ncbi:MAG: hypothetical protein C0617_05845 [Desulfuromonas sp.]|uniref:hypothetical protein n=1 Tax=Desulfuromonas sp. TaxID=892 RepID=UPI000CB9B530|nr:hypothetical protein [Desulfuromonas sp.]PLX84976.1 MAG: hypothetical protein C0617_05845 [Desulfuromonas sp.]
MKKLAQVGKTLKRSQRQIQDKIGEFLGCQVLVSKPETSTATREEVFAPLDSKMVLARLGVEGDRKGEAFLLFGLEGAIRLGGTLIMLPPSELDSRVQNEAFTEEEDDAFGEIVNLLAGALTAVFVEHFSPKLHFRKADLQPIDPLQDEETALQALPEGTLAQSCFELSMDGQALGPMILLLPGPLLEEETEEEEAEPAAQPEPAQAASPAAPHPAPPAENSGSQPVVVIAPGSEASQPFAQALAESGMTAECLGYEEDYRGFVQKQNVRGVFLVMEEVNDQGLALIIQLRAALEKSVPLLAAGPQWTKSTVLQAVKYGANDILITPAETGLIREKIRASLGSESEGKPLEGAA